MSFARKAFYWLQWVVLAAIAGLVVWVFIRPEPELDYDRSSWHSWRGFLALSYPTISREGSDKAVSTERLAEHLEALKEAGFKTIRPADVVAFLDGTSPLPERAVLLMFEFGRKESFFGAMPLLSRLGQVGVMNVPVSSARSWDQATLKHSDLVKIAGTRNWDLGSMGDEAIKQITLDREGTEGHFLSRARWLGRRVENQDEFRSRIERDFSEAASFLEGTNGGAPVELYLFPYADQGQGREAHVAAWRVNREQVARHHKIAFVNAADPYNARYVDRYALTRLRVSGLWDAAELIDRLEIALPQEHELPTGFNLSNWKTTGKTSFRRDKIVLGEGAQAWLRGSSVWPNLEIKLEAGPAADGTIFVFARHRGPDSYLRLSLRQESLLIQEKLGDRLQTLARHAIGENAGGVHSLSLRLKGNRAWVALDGVEIADPLPLGPRTAGGRFGVACEGVEAVIAALDISAIPSRALILPTGAALPWEAGLETATYLMPSWFSDLEATLDLEKQNFVLAAGSFGVKTIPLVSPGEDPSPERAAHFARELAGGMRASSLGHLVPYLAVPAAREELTAALRAEGFNMVLITSLERALESVQADRIGQNDLLFIEGAMSEDILELLHYLPPERIMIMAEAGEPEEGLPEGICTVVKTSDAPTGDSR